MISYIQQQLQLQQQKSEKCQTVGIYNMLMVYGLWVDDGQFLAFVVVGFFADKLIRRTKQKVVVSFA
jgi:hypothetical protein